MLMVVVVREADDRWYRGEGLLCNWEGTLLSILSERTKFEEKSNNDGCALKLQINI